MHNVARFWKLETGSQRLPTKTSLLMNMWSDFKPFIILTKKCFSKDCLHIRAQISMTNSLQTLEKAFKNLLKAWSTYSLILHRPSLLFFLKSSNTVSKEVSGYSIPVLALARACTRRDKAQVTGRRPAVAGVQFQQQASHPYWQAWTPEDLLP